MGRAVKDSKLDSRTGRAVLAERAEPYWRLINEGAHLGYYKGRRVGKWVARFRSPGTGKGYLKKTLGEADDTTDADGSSILSFRQAQEAARDWFAVAAGGRRGSYTVSNALDDYMKDFKARGQKSYDLTLGRIEANIRPDLGDISLDRLTEDHVQNWRDQRAAEPAKLRTSRVALAAGAARNTRVKPDESDHAALAEWQRRRRSSANRDLTILKASLNYSLRKKKLSTDKAWRHVAPFQKVVVARTRRLLDDEARRLVNACASVFRPMVQAALLCGARYGELCKVRVEHFDDDSGTIIFTETKGGRDRTVPLEDDGIELLRTQTAGKVRSALIFPRADGKAWTAGQQNRFLRAAANSAKIEKTGFHDLRRSYGAKLASKGVPMGIISQMLGHADERITSKHYAQYAPSHAAAAVRAALSGGGFVERSNVRSLSAIGDP